MYSSITELIGNTPLVELNKYARKRDLKANIIAEVEFFNPAIHEKTTGKRYLSTDLVE